MKRLYTQLSALALALLLLVCTPMPSISESLSFHHHIHEIKTQLLNKGISETIIERAFASVSPNKTIKARHDKQPELRSSIASYVKRRVTPAHITLGKKSIKSAKTELKKSANTFGVDPYIVASIWGLESAYGAILNNDKLMVPVLDALVNLGYKIPAKKAFAFKQIHTLFKMEASGGKKTETIRGSWAGAIGHTQFIPTTMHAYAVNGDNDITIDLENSIADALASTAHYLHIHDWNPNLYWGRQVTLPKNFHFSLATNTSQTISFWRHHGVIIPHEAVPHLGDDLTLFLPIGAKGPAFLLTPNFQVIKAYNHSTSYALAVGILADALSGRGGYIAWPDDKGLTKTEAKTIQEALQVLGYYNDTVDGIIGNKTRFALIAYQKAIGARADGYPDKQLLSVLSKSTSSISKND